MEYPELKAKKVIVFDLDDTLSRSKSPIDSDMADLLCALLSKKEVAIISGGAFSQIEKQVASNLHCTDSLHNLHIFPTNGACYAAYSGGAWHEIYKEDLSQYDKERITQALHEAIAAVNFPAEEIFGELIEDRGTQITYSGLGQQAPLDRKNKWDPSGHRRKLLIAALRRHLPQYEIHMGGKTSIDISKQGQTKAYAIGKIEQYLNVTKDDIAFVGDALSEDGNDYPVIATGVLVIAVKDPEETKKLIRYIISL
jgi:phosphomannomutase